MLPLYTAFAHGCAAGKYQEVLDEIYWPRIQRGEEFFSTSKLGAFGVDLAALAGFFASPWHELQLGVKETWQAHILNQAGFRLRALGRLKESEQPTELAFHLAVSQNDWNGIVRFATNRCEIYLALGELAQACELAQQNVELAALSGGWVEQIGCLETLADALHQSGQLVEAEAALSKAETIQKSYQPTNSFLYSTGGFRYCDLLLEQGRLWEVRNRALQTIEIAKRNSWLLAYALDNLSLGRAWLLQSWQAGNGNYGQAAEFLQRAVDGLRQAGYLDYLPRGLLARAGLHRGSGDYQRALTDLAEAKCIAVHGEMRLHEADCYLEFARLSLATGDRKAARKAWEKAKAMIEEMGYHRRDGEVKEIEGQL